MGYYIVGALFLLVFCPPGVKLQQPQPVAVPSAGDQQSGTGMEVNLQPGNCDAIDPEVAVKEGFTLNGEETCGTLSQTPMVKFDLKVTTFYSESYGEHITNMQGSICVEMDSVVYGSGSYVFFLATGPAHQEVGAGYDIMGVFFGGNGSSFDPYVLTFEAEGDRIAKLRSSEYCVNHLDLVYDDVHCNWPHQRLEFQGTRPTISRTSDKTLVPDVKFKTAIRLKGDSDTNAKPLARIQKILDEKDYNESCTHQFALASKTHAASPFPTHSMPNYIRDTQKSCMGLSDDVLMHGIQGMAQTPLTSKINYTQFFVLDTNQYYFGLEGSICLEQTLGLGNAFLDYDGTLRVALALTGSLPYNHLLEIHVNKAGFEVMEKWDMHTHLEPTSSADYCVKNFIFVPSNQAGLGLDGNCASGFHVMFKVYRNMETQDLQLMTLDYLSLQYVASIVDISPPLSLNYLGMFSVVKPWFNYTRQNIQEPCGGDTANNGTMEDNSNEKFTVTSYKQWGEFPGASMALYMYMWGKSTYNLHVGGTVCTQGANSLEDIYGLVLKFGIEANGHQTSATTGDVKAPLRGGVYMTQNYVGPMGTNEQYLNSEFCLEKIAVFQKLPGLCGGAPGVQFQINHWPGTFEWNCFNSSYCPEDWNLDVSLEVNYNMDNSMSYYSSLNDNYPYRNFHPKTSFVSPHFPIGANVPILLAKETNERPASFKDLCTERLKKLETAQLKQYITVDQWTSVSAYDVPASSNDLLKFNGSDCLIAGRTPEETIHARVYWAHDPTFNDANYLEVITNRRHGWFYNRKDGYDSLGWNDVCMGLFAQFEEPACDSGYAIYYEVWKEENCWGCNFATGVPIYMGTEVAFGDTATRDITGRGSFQLSDQTMPDQTNPTAATGSPDVTNPKPQGDGTVQMQPGNCAAIALDKATQQGYTLNGHTNCGSLTTPGERYQLEVTTFYSLSYGQFITNMEGSICVEMGSVAYDSGTYLLFLATGPAFDVVGNGYDIVGVFIGGNATDFDPYVITFEAENRQASVRSAEYCVPNLQFVYDMQCEYPHRRLKFQLSRPSISWSSSKTLVPGTQFKTAIRLWGDNDAKRKPLERIQKMLDDYNFFETCTHQFELYSEPHAGSPFPENSLSNFIRTPQKSCMGLQDDKLMSGVAGIAKTQIFNTLYYTQFLVLDTNQHYFGFEGSICLPGNVGLYSTYFRDSNTLYFILALTDSLANNHLIEVSMNKEKFEISEKWDMGDSFIPTSSADYCVKNLIFVPSNQAGLGLDENCASGYHVMLKIYRKMETQDLQMGQLGWASVKYAVATSEFYHPLTLENLGTFSVGQPSFNYTLNNLPTDSKCKSKEDDDDDNAASQDDDDEDGKHAGFTITNLKQWGNYPATSVSAYMYMWEGNMYNLHFAGTVCTQGVNSLQEIWGGIGLKVEIEANGYKTLVKADGVHNTDEPMVASYYVMPSSPDENYLYPTEFCFEKIAVFSKIPELCQGKPGVQFKVNHWPGTFEWNCFNSGYCPAEWNLDVALQVNYNNYDSTGYYSPLNNSYPYRNFQPKTSLVTPDFPIGANVPILIEKNNDESTYSNKVFCKEMHNNTKHAEVKVTEVLTVDQWTKVHVMHVTESSGHSWYLLKFTGSDCLIKDRVPEETIYTRVYWAYDSDFNDANYLEIITNRRYGSFYNRNDNPNANMYQNEQCLGLFAQFKEPACDSGYAVYYEVLKKADCPMCKFSPGLAIHVGTEAAFGGSAWRTISHRGTFYLPSTGGNPDDKGSTASGIVPVVNWMFIVASFILALMRQGN